MRTYFYLLLLIIVTVPFVVHGQATNNTFVPLQPELFGIKELAKSNTIPALLNNIYKICIGVAATLAVLQIMRAGVMYMGGDSVTEKKDAKNLIAMSITGLLLVLSPVIVFSIINPEILSLKIGAINLQQVSPQSSNSSGAGANPNLAAQCAQYTGSNIKQVPNPNNQTCTKLPGAGDGWSSVPQCCSNLQAGFACCGYSDSNKGTVTPPPVVSTGAYHYTALVGDSATNPKCSIVSPSSNFRTLTTCTADMQKTLQNGYSAIDIDCAGKPVARTALYNKLDKLPTCKL